MTTTSAKKIAPRKIEGLKEIKERLAQSGDFILATYSGLDVVQMGEVRAKIREKNSSLKIIKNNLFKIALRDSPAHKNFASEMDAELKGPIAVVFAGKNLPSVSKALVEYSKTESKLQVKIGCMNGKVLAKDEIIQIATLPSREELLAQIARGLNTPATQIASGLNQIMASLARAIRATGEKNG